MRIKTIMYVSIVSVLCTSNSFSNDRLFDKLENYTNSYNRGKINYSMYITYQPLVPDEKKARVKATNKVENQLNTLKSLVEKGEVDESIYYEMFKNKNSEIQKIVDSYIKESYVSLSNCNLTFIGNHHAKLLKTNNRNDHAFKMFTPSGTLTWVNNYNGSQEEAIQKPLGQAIWEQDKIFNRSDLEFFIFEEIFNNWYRFDEMEIMETDSVLSAKLIGKDDYHTQKQKAFQINFEINKKNNFFKNIEIYNDNIIKAIDYSDFRAVEGLDFKVPHSYKIEEYFDKNDDEQGFYLGRSILVHIHDINLELNISSSELLIEIPDAIQIKNLNQ